MVEKVIKSQNLPSMNTKFKVPLKISVDTGRYECDDDHTHSQASYILTNSLRSHNSVCNIETLTLIKQQSMSQEDDRKNIA